MAHDVFISHCSSDKDVAVLVRDSLENCGIPCWIALRDVVPGLPYAECIVKAISEAKVFVLVFSERVNTSAHVMREVERAVSKGIPILPFRIENATPRDSMEYFLSSPHWLDAITPPIERHLKKLVDVTAGLLSVQSGDALASSAEAPASGESGRHSPISGAPVLRSTGSRQLRVRGEGFLCARRPNYLQTLGLSIVATVVLYLGLLHPLAELWEGSLAAIFCSRGPMPYAMTFVFVYTVAFLLCGFRIIRKNAGRVSKIDFRNSTGEVSPAMPEILFREEGSEPLSIAVVEALSLIRESGDALPLDEFLGDKEFADLSALSMNHRSAMRMAWLIMGFGMLGSLVGVYEASRGVSAIASIGGADMEVLTDSLRIVVAGAHTAFEPTLLGIALFIVLVGLSRTTQKLETSLCSKTYDSLRVNASNQGLRRCQRVSARQGSVRES